MLPVQPRISVFGAVGAGGGRFHNYTLNSDNPPQLATYADYHGVFSAGGGIDFRIARHVSIRVDARDYVTGRGLGGVLGRNHFLPMAGIALHYWLADSRNHANQKIADHADPEVDRQSPIDTIKLMLSARRKVSIDTVVDGVSRQHGDERLPERAVEDGTFRYRHPGGFRIQRIAQNEFSHR